VLDFDAPTETTIRSIIQRLVRFLKSVLPTQSGQAALLAGSLLLLTVFRLGSWHLWTIALYQSQGDTAARVFGWLAKLPLTAVYFGGAAGLWLGFDSKPNPSKWLTRFVVFPVVAGWLANIAVAKYFQQRFPYVSAANLPQSFTHGATSDSFLGNVGLGFWVTLVGLSLILVVHRSLSRSELDLPVTFGDAIGEPVECQTRKFVWLMVVCTMPLTLLFTTVALASANPAFWQNGLNEHHLLELFIQLVTAVPFAGLLLFAVGPGAWRILRPTMKSPPIGYIVLAIAFPFLIASIPGVFAFAVARVQWASSEYGQFDKPLLRDQFINFGWNYFWMLISALVEEIAWRGYLQPRLISRYGLYRGIFFVGIVWGAFHFPSDFGPTTHLIDFVAHCAGRLVNCVAWGFVLSWLTLRSRSVIPAGISHGVMNALYTMRWPGDVSNWIMYFFWAALAVVLFRYWPPVFKAAGPPSAAGGDDMRGSTDVVPGTA
jgi:membrane protease YdiL (CAAX protease family)